MIYVEVISIGPESRDVMISIMTLLIKALRVSFHVSLLKISVMFWSDLHKA